jgi:hypothetical protein
MVERLRSGEADADLVTCVEASGCGNGWNGEKVIAEQTFVMRG